MYFKDFSATFVFTQNLTLSLYFHSLINETCMKLQIISNKINETLIIFCYLVDLYSTKKCEKQQVRSVQKIAINMSIFWPLMGTKKRSKTDEITLTKLMQNFLKQKFDM